MLPIAAPPGYATSVLHIYGLGPYIAPIGQSFGWTRTRVTVGGSGLGQAAAAAFVGLTLGAEVDVVVYLTTRHFGLKSFGGLYGGLLTALSIGTATGPLAAAAVFDAYGSYAPFLWLTIAFMVASSAALLSLPKPAER